MKTSAARPTSPNPSNRQLVIVLVGIDGAGKTTAARALSKLLGPSIPTLVLANYSGRRTMTAWAERFGVTLPTRVLDSTESVIRAANVISNNVRSRSFEGIIIMDRHLHCQQALRSARGLRPGRFIAAMTALLPAPDAVVFLDVSPEEAHHRITLRGTDTETLEDLRAYRAGYLGLTELASFQRVPADGPLPTVLDDLEEVVHGLRQGAMMKTSAPLSTTSTMSPLHRHYAPANGA
ncbi:nucleoside/nucleotide kinase family protein [Arthrobacter sp. MDT2-16]